MSLTRRKLFGWVAALFGGAAVAKVASAEAQRPTHFLWTDIVNPPTPDAFKREFGVAPVSREHGVTLTSGEQAFALNPALEVPARGHCIDGDACTRCGKHRAICALRACDPPGYVPPDEYAHGVTPGWTFRKYEGDA